MDEIFKDVMVGTKTTATTDDAKYRYEISYEVVDNGKEFKTMSANIKTVDNSLYIGSFSWNNGNKTISIPDNADGSLVNTMFDAVVAKIKSKLVVA